MRFNRTSIFTLTLQQMWFNICEFHLDVCAKFLFPLISQLFSVFGERNKQKNWAAMIVTLHSRLPGQCSSLLLVREATPKVSFKTAFWLPPCSWRGSDSQTTLVNSRHLRSDCLVPHASDFPPLTKLLLFLLCEKWEKQGLPGNECPWGIQQNSLALAHLPEGWWDWRPVLSLVKPVS